MRRSNWKKTRIRRTSTWEGKNANSYRRDELCSLSSQVACDCEDADSQPLRLPSSSKPNESVKSTYPQPYLPGRRLVSSVDSPNAISISISLLPRSVIRKQKSSGLPIAADLLLSSKASPYPVNRGKQLFQRTTLQLPTSPGFSADPHHIRGGRQCDKPTVATGQLIVSARASRLKVESRLRNQTRLPTLYRLQSKPRSQFLREL